MRFETRDPGALEKPLTRVNFRVVRLKTCRITRYPGILEEIPRGILFRDNISFQADRLMLQNDKSRRQVASGVERMQPLGVMVQPPRDRAAYRHTDGQQRQAKETDEAQGESSSIYP